MKKRADYHAALNRDLKPSAAEIDLMRRRVRPFIDRQGLEQRPLESILMEVYMQGLRDAAEAST